MDFGDDDPFGVEAVKSYEKALQQAKGKGAKVTWLMLCNPHNPTGACFSREALVALVELAVKHQIHLVSDEIYALSVYRDIPSRPNFTSVLSLDLERMNASKLVHVLYGLSKVCSNALKRLKRLANVLI